MTSAAPRALFVNSGILGHASVARLLREAADAAGLDAAHEDLSHGLTTGERIVRRLLCAGPAPGTTAGGWTRARWRHEYHAGLQAARRIAARERGGARFDVVHFHTQATAWASLGRMRRAPAVVSIDATQRLAAEGAPPAARADHERCAARDRLVFRAAAAIVSTSRRVADDLADDLPEAAGRVHVLPYPVPPEGFGAAWPEARHARFADDPSAPVRLLFVGGDFARKGGDALLAAWRDGGFACRATLTIVSDHAPAELPPGVEVRRGVRAYTPAWFDAWREADAFVMPTRAEAFGMVFQEAAAAGLPAVGTTVGAVPELVADGETGVLVAPGDGPALVRALRAVLASPERRRAMGEAARRRAVERWSPAGYAARLGEIVRGAVAAGAPR